MGAHRLAQAAGAAHVVLQRSDLAGIEARQPVVLADQDGRGCRCQAARERRLAGGDLAADEMQRRCSIRHGCSKAPPPRPNRSVPADCRLLSRRPSIA